MLGMGVMVSSCDENAEVVKEIVKKKSKTACHHMIRISEIINNNDNTIC